MKLLRTASVSCALVVLATAPVAANEAYYAVIFAAQTPDNQARFSHTFAAFVKVDDAAAKNPAVHTSVISWLPANGNIRVVRLRPEPGKNFGLKETLDWAAELRLNCFSIWSICNQERAV